MTTAPLLSTTTTTPDNASTPLPPTAVVIGSTAIRFSCRSNYSMNDYVRGPDLSWSNPHGTIQSEVSNMDSGGIGMVVAEYEALAGPHLNAVSYQCTANITNWLPDGLVAADDNTPVNYEDSCNITLCK